MGLELYLDLISQPCRSVYIFAKKNNIPFELKHTLLSKGQHMDATFRAVNLLMKVPALKDGDFTLAESIAILLYLARKFQTPDHWYPADLQKRARVDEYLSWQHTGVRMFGSKVFLIKTLLPLFLGCSVPPEKLERAVEGLNEALKAFEEKFLQDRPFIAGNEISLADLVALVELMQPVGAGHDIFEGRPKLAAWRRRVEDKVGKDLVLEAHKPLLQPENVAVDQLPPATKEQLTQSLLKYVQ
ncbi:glutathione S-transferase theta-1-like [Tiliqua scincoides]|uniref:glutathione S-transferase theta-1-like n=1 Tax=Tiliqua scincoides TaxID=71010 RepID=UPI003462F61F